MSDWHKRVREAHRILTEAGIPAAIWETGGGCTCAGINLDDDVFAQEGSHIMVTDGENPEIPDEFIVGFYGPVYGDEPILYTVRDADLAERVRDLIDRKDELVAQIRP